MLLGVDVGGTFTDAALIKDGRLITAKAPSTPDDQSKGVIAAVEAALDRAEAEPGDVERFVHGMTVGTNALLEGKVAKTALLATAGFVDLEELGRQARPELYRLCVGHPPPLVPPELRVPVPERCGPDGVIEELDEDGLRELLADLPDDVEAVAVCLLWGFRHHDHEKRARRARARRRPRVALARGGRRLPRVRALRDHDRRRRRLPPAAPLPRAAERPGERRRPAHARRSCCPAAAWSTRPPPPGTARGPC